MFRHFRDTRTGEVLSTQCQMFAFPFMTEMRDSFRYGRDFHCPWNCNYAARIWLNVEFRDESSSSA